MKMRKPSAGVRSTKAPRSGGAKPSARLDREIQARIGDQLRAMHDSIVKEGVPDRFVELLAKLDKSAGRE
ncbi:MAG: NepR family anti-sigma factor [Bauldia sp.]